MCLGIQETAVERLGWIGRSPDSLRGSRNQSQLDRPENRLYMVMESCLMMTRGRVVVVVVAALADWVTNSREQITLFSYTENVIFIVSCSIGTVTVTLKFGNAVWD